MGLNMPTTISPMIKAMITGETRVCSAERPEARVITISDERAIDKNSATVASTMLSGRIRLIF